MFVLHQRRGKHIGLTYLFLEKKKLSSFSFPSSYQPTFSQPYVCDLCLYEIAYTKLTVDKLQDFFTCHFIFDNTASGEFFANQTSFFPRTAPLTYPAVC